MTWSAGVRRGLELQQVHEILPCSERLRRAHLLGKAKAEQHVPAFEMVALGRRPLKLGQVLLSCAVKARVTPTALPIEEGAPQLSWSQGELDLAFLELWPRLESAVSAL